MRKEQRTLKNKKIRLVVGIDEVGRGPLAGPVSVCVLMMTASQYLKFQKTSDRKKLRDSKKLSAKMREEWFGRILKWQKEGLLDFAYVSSPAKKIDANGISVVIKKCLAKGLVDLEIPTDAQILLDGSLCAPAQFKNQKTIIKGDEKEAIISLASIVAKVTRDKYMTAIAKKYPKYGFEIHKGYGTLMHRKAIKKYGISLIHRGSFCRFI